GHAAHKRSGKAACPMGRDDDQVRIDLVSSLRDEGGDRFVAGADEERRVDPDAAQLLDLPSDLLLQLGLIREGRVAAGAASHHLVGVHGDDPGTVLPRQFADEVEGGVGELGAVRCPDDRLEHGFRPFLAVARLDRSKSRRIGCRTQIACGFPADSLSRVHRLTQMQARRIAVRAQLLDTPRPKDLLEVVERLTLLQVDPTAAVAPNADLVAWSRLGSSYRPAHLTHALEDDRTLFEFNALIRPMSDLGLHP